jgi:Ca-activated chloride channel family protein
VSQGPSDQDSGAFVFKSQVEEVILHATVVDEQRHLVPNLDRIAFAVFEDGVQQKISSFHREDVPVAMGIVIDNSGSMREKRDKVNEAVLNLLRENNPEDEIFVTNFSQDSYLDQDFTSDLGLLRDALQKISMQGSTALYDAIVASSIHLKNNIHLENKVLLVITDGEDNASRETLEEARQRLQQQNAPTLYAIGLLANGARHSDREALDGLADSTGGAAFFPRSLDELNDISRTIGHDIRSRYTIGYKSTNPKENRKYRTIQVKAQVRGSRQLSVRTRSGYLPGETDH